MKVWLSTRRGKASAVSTEPVPCLRPRTDLAGAIYTMEGIGDVRFRLDASYDGCTWVELDCMYLTSLGQSVVVKPSRAYALVRASAVLSGVEVDAFVELNLSCRVA